MKKLMIASLLGVMLITSAILPAVANIEAQAKTTKMYQAGVKVSTSTKQVKKLMTQNKKETGSAYYNEDVYWTSAFTVEKGVFKKYDTHEVATASAKSLNVHKDFHIKKGLMYYKNKKFTGVMKEIVAMPAYKQVSYYHQGKLVSFNMQILGTDQVKA